MQAKKYKHTGKKYKHAGKTDIQAKIYKHTGKKMQTERQKTTNIRAKNTNTHPKKNKNTGANLVCCFLVTTDGAQHCESKLYQILVIHLHLHFL